MSLEGPEKMGNRLGWGRRAAGGLAVAAAIGVALLFIGSAAATPVSAAAASMTDKPPYSGLEASNDFGLLSGSGGPICGVAESFVLAPFFNMTTGHANESVKATAHSCGPGTSWASPEEAAGFDSSNFTTTSGMHHIKATWVIDLSAKLVATPGSPSQSAESYFIVDTQLYLLDLTNASVFDQANYPFLVFSITSGTYSHTYPKVVQTVFLNATLAKGHIYEFGVFVYLDVYASVSPGTSSASASANMGSGGRNAFLSSVTGL